MLGIEYSPCYDCDKTKCSFCELTRYKDLQQKNKNLTPANENLSFDLTSAKAEIERLSKELGYQCLYWASYWKDVFEAGMEKLKAETIEDFAEDLMARAYLSSNWSNSERAYVVEVNDIDTLVKEKIGEQE